MKHFSLWLSLGLISLASPALANNVSPLVTDYRGGETRAEHTQQRAYDHRTSNNGADAVNNELKRQMLQNKQLREESVAPQKTISPNAKP